MKTAPVSVSNLDIRDFEVNAPIFVVGCHKSGTSLLRSLLDGHPELASIPFETHIPNSFGLPVTYPLKRTSTEAANNGSEVRERLYQLFDQYRSDRRTTDDADLSFIGTNSAEQRKAAVRALKIGHELDQASIGSYLAVAFFLATGDAVRGRRIVEKSVEHIEILHLLLLAFPAAKAVQIVRAPEDTLAAIRRTYTKTHRSFPYLRPIVETLTHTRNLMAQNQAAFDGRTLTISYQELTESPQETMTSIASFLGIQFNDMLLQPTMLGHPWGGNSSQGTTFSGVQANPSRRTSAVEIATLEAAGLLEKRAWSRTRGLLPARREWPPQYIMNRLMIATRTR